MSRQTQGTTTHGPSTRPLSRLSSLGRLVELIWQNVAQPAVLTNLKAVNSTNLKSAFNLAKLRKCNFFLLIQNKKVNIENNISCLQVKEFLLFLALRTSFQDQEVGIKENRKQFQFGIFFRVTLINTNLAETIEIEAETLKSIYV